MRQRTTDASLAMFIEEGYEKTSIRNIADKIEYSPATIYLYYKDKDELLYDVQGEAFKQLLELFEQKVVSKSPWKRLEQLCQGSGAVRFRRPSRLQRKHGHPQGVVGTGQYRQAVKEGRAPPAFPRQKRQPSPKETSEKDETHLACEEGNGSPVRRR